MTRTRALAAVAATIVASSFIDVVSGFPGLSEVEGSLRDQVSGRQPAGRNRRLWPAGIHDVV
jgi:hypothetical protein